MNKKTIGITVGPIIDTLKLTSTPAGLWGASFMFSFIVRKIIEKLIESGYVKENDFLVPSWNESNIEKIYKSQGGLLHDRIIFNTEDNRSLENVKIVVDDVKKEISCIIINAFSNSGIKTSEEEKEKIFCYIKKYIQIHIVEINADEENLIVKIGEYLSLLELSRTYPETESTNYILKFLENRDSIQMAKSSDRNKILKNSEFVKDKKWHFLVNNKIVSIDDIAGIDSNEKNKNGRGYFALVQMDGDNLGKKISKMKEYEIKSFSDNCIKNAYESCNLIEEYGGKTIYAGGDDLLFIAPVRSNDDTCNIDNVLELVKKLNEKFKENFADGYEDVTLSSGMIICYYKYPLYEALNSAFSQLEKSKESGKNRITICFERHSVFMGSLQVVNDKENENSLLQLMIEWIKNSNDKNILRSIQKKLLIYRKLILDSLKTKDEEVIKIVLYNLFDDVEDVKTNYDMGKSIEFICNKLNKLEDIDDEKMNMIIDELITFIDILKFYNGKE